MALNPIHINDLDKEGFIEDFDREGFVLVKGVFDDEFIESMVPELEAAIEKEAAFHGSTDYNDYGLLLACPIYGGRFLEVPGNEAFIKPFEWVLDDTCIIWVYTSSSMPPNNGNRSAKIHVDRPHFIPGYTEAMGSLILLNDFTEENGATWILKGSHNDPNPPDEKYFYDNAIRLIAPKGTVIYFNLRLWHAGGANLTNDWRHCLGIGMIRAGLKQRIDLPKALKNVDVSGLSDAALQKLGFFSQPPSSLEEYYAPQEERKYKQRSEWNR